MLTSGDGDGVVGWDVSTDVAGDVNALKVWNRSVVEDTAGESLWGWGLVGVGPHLPASVGLASDDDLVDVSVG